MQHKDFFLDLLLAISAISRDSVKILIFLLIVQKNLIFPLDRKYYGQ